MKGRLLDLSVGLNRKQRLTLEIDGDFRQEFDNLHEADLDIEIKKYRQKRSLVLIDKIAKVMRIEKKQVYQEAIRNIGGVSETVCVQAAAVDRLCSSWAAHGLGWQADVMPSKLEGCSNVVLYFGSSTYDTRQMSALIDQLVQDAKALGIETLPPNELSRLAGYERI